MSWVDYVAILGTIGTLFGVAISVYLWLVSLKVAVPVFDHGPRELIIRMEDERASSSLNVMRLARGPGPLRAEIGESLTETSTQGADEWVRVDQDVYVVRFTFWNGGTRPMRRGEILEPFRVLLQGEEVQILDVPKVLNVTRDVCAVSLDLDGASPDSVLVDFTILEPGDGFYAQVLFSCATLKTINIEGTIEGVAKIARVVDETAGEIYIGRAMGLLAVPIWGIFGYWAYQEWQFGYVVGGLFLWAFVSMLVGGVIRAFEWLYFPPRRIPPAVLGLEERSVPPWKDFLKSVSEPFDRPSRPRYP